MSIKSVAVIGSGTMGLGIAAVCANAGCHVFLLDIEKALADNAVERMQAGRSPMITDPEALARIKTGALDDSLEGLRSYDWICEAVIENIEIKQALFAKLEPYISEHSVISTNTSGIPLKEICKTLPAHIQERITITHFFNPVNVMKLVELIPSESTRPDVFSAFDTFLSERLNKGVVYAKDTVNFIGNRIGCFWMLAGLHAGEALLNDHMTLERVDALMGAAGLPSTGLYGLVDLIGLDVMYHVGRNLDDNLPQEDVGRRYNQFPANIQKMYDQKQLGRKTGGGFYKMIKLDDGDKRFETFDPVSFSWRDKQGVDAIDASFESIYFSDCADGEVLRQMIGETLLYAADLVPEISDTLAHIDKAMQWGFAWKHGPFELLDQLDPMKVIAAIESQQRPMPKMLAVLKDSGKTRFYNEDKTQCLQVDGTMAAV